MRQRIPATQIKSEFEHLIQQAEELEPELAKRLKWFVRWIKNKKPGLLMKKRLVMDLLIEIYQDAKLWLAIKTCTPDELTEFWEQAQMYPPERYWYEILFPRWFQQSDIKLETWTSKIMSEQFNQSDLSLINTFKIGINRHGGYTFTRYILDLSMATDILISGSLGKPLTVQLTIVASKYEDKYTKWQETLKYWQICRGVFLRHEPTRFTQQVQRLLELSDTLDDNCYHQET